MSTLIGEEKLPIVLKVELPTPNFEDKVAAIANDFRFFVIDDVLIGKPTLPHLLSELLIKSRSSSQ